ncbi:hypothetical protein BU14_0098s0021 [Porphyra umbilicalis]|uniref:Uncharacterized protein n=1 Tax=Porphyra umbilicalis TaxID=2786 RepID=A0A1X6PDL0_PORUM|nr:hypothetical protein BU14_0098s0021 [Porphyra umbilicalis]|eukprot:OSX78795.1 hypothetical protein BU14_0098s0021 [Porphyra umbilicalis]
MYTLRFTSAPPVHAAPAQRAPESNAQPFRPLSPASPPVSPSPASPQMSPSRPSPALSPSPPAPAVRAPSRARPLDAAAHGLWGGGHGRPPQQRVERLAQIPPVGRHAIARRARIHPPAVHGAQCRVKDVTVGGAHRPVRARHALRGVDEVAGHGRIVGGRRRLDRLGAVAGVVGVWADEDDRHAAVLIVGGERLDGAADRDDKGAVFADEEDDRGGRAADRRQRHVLVLRGRVQRPVGGGRQGRAALTGENHGDGGVWRRGRGGGGGCTPQRERGMVGAVAGWSARVADNSQASREKYSTRPTARCR